MLLLLNVVASHWTPLEVVSYIPNLLHDDII